MGTYVRAVGRELVRRGHRVSVIALGREEERITFDEGVRILWKLPGNLHWHVSRVPLLGRALSLPVREIEYSMTVLRAVREIDAIEPVDIVEGTETGSYYFSKLRPGIKSVIRLHGEMFTFKKYSPPGHIPVGVRFSRYLQRRALRRCDLLTSPSHAHASEIVADLKRREISPSVVPNPVPQEILAMRAGVCDKDHPLFLYVGRLQNVKGVIPLLKAIPIVLRQIPNARFVFAGSRHPSLPWNEIGKMLSRLGIEDSVIFLGHVEYSKLLALYECAAAVVLPSFYETFGYVLLEALMHGAPVVASDIAAVRELLKGHHSALLVEPGDVEALADACVRIIRREGRPASADDFTEFSVTVVTEKLLGIYNSLSVSNISADPICNIFLSPHFDDAVFSCGGIMHKYRKRGKKNLVITLFGGLPESSGLSPFAREIHNKWKVEDPVSLRMKEDRTALEMIGAREIHLDFLDCIYRKTKNGVSLYNNYEEIRGVLHPEDLILCGDIYEKVKETVQSHDPAKTHILVPLGIGNHVDHQIAYKVGLSLSAEGFKVSFFEDFPYCMWYPEEIRTIVERHETPLSPSVISIEMDFKLKMIKNYNTQLYGIGGNYKKASNNFRKYALTVGRDTHAERIWLSPPSKEPGSIRSS